jgi:hypothetical protein
MWRFFNPMHLVTMGLEKTFNCPQTKNNLRPGKDPSGTSQIGVKSSCGVKIPILG